MREIHVLRLPWDNTKTKKQTTVTDPSILQLQILDGLIKNKFVWLSVQKKKKLRTMWDIAFDLNVTKTSYNTTAVIANHLRLEGLQPTLGWFDVADVLF